MTLTFPLPVNLANSRMHWRTKHTLHREWKAMALALEPALRLRQRGRPKVPFQRITVQLTFYVYSRSDTDNLVSRAKWVLDFLVERGFVVDDGPDHVQWVGMPTQVVDRKRPRIELTIQEAA